KLIFGWSITRETNLVVRTILLTLNAGSLAVYLFLLSRLVERLGLTEWGRLFTFAAGCFGTYVTTFSVTLNNHTRAATTVLCAVSPILSTDESEPLPVRAIITAGFFAGLAVCLELPAAAFAGLLFLVLLYRAPLLTLNLGLPVALAPIAL